jgi:hypothetical protein
MTRAIFGRSWREAWRINLSHATSGFWRRSILRFGIGGASSTCGAGPIGSRPIRHPRDGSSATTPCRSWGRGDRLGQCRAG